ncbi:MAG: thiamine diphosphokinase [Bacteroidaceae bacterium]|nr:thiamine diphosphokinase [Bacteroidaceae bacterium]
MKDKVYDAVIVAGGEYPTARQPLEVLHGAPFVVCCDGAADNYIATGRVPDAIVGDGDSISAENREMFAHLLHIVSEQESNDQTKAVRFLVEKGMQRIAIVGATGKREDHTIGNISLLIEYARQGCDVCSFTDYGVFIPCNGTTTHKCHKGQQVSIFSITAKDLSAVGLRYPIYDFNNWWQGTLNECTGEEFTINANGEYLLFISYLPKAL